MTSAGGGGAFASAGNALAQAFAGTGGSGKMLDLTPIPDQPFEEIPRAQGPFRSGQDNQEPIFDNSGIKIGADFGSPGDTVTMQDVEEGKKHKGSRRTSRLQRHISTALAFAGDRPAWVDAFLQEFRQVVWRSGIEPHCEFNVRWQYYTQEPTTFNVEEGRCIQLIVTS